jgi:rubredoxin
MIPISVHDPDIGDRDADIQPGMGFEDVPPDDSCPICGADGAKMKS